VGYVCDARRRSSGAAGLDRARPPRRPPGSPATDDGPLLLSTREGWTGATPNAWGLPEAIVGFAVGLVLAGTAASIVSGIVGYHSGRGALPVAVTVCDVGALWIGLAGSAVWASRRRGTSSLVRDFGFRVGGVWDLVGGAAVGLGSQYLLIPALYFPAEQLDSHLAHQLSAPAQRDTAAAHGLIPIVVLFAFLAIGAPIVEELFFRGLVLRGLLGRVPAAAAIVVSGLLFALAHFEPVQFAGLAAFGVILGVLAWRTGRLGPGMAAHAAFNASAVLSLAHLH
jgi:membrane protease YdiL (CAAX protease family)